MNTFDKFKDLYCGDFDSSATNFPSNLNALSYNVAREQNNKFEKEIYNLIEFIRLWKDRYELFCGKFNAYSYTKQNMPVWSEGYTENGYLKLTYPKSEFYIDEFFNMVLNKRAKFEIQEYRKNYDSVYDMSGKIYLYAIQPEQNIIISGDKFTISGKDGWYRLDIKMNAALICSFIVALSNNYIIYDWYSKQSRFKEFIDKMAKGHYFVCFGLSESNGKHLSLEGSDVLTNMLIDVNESYLYFILPNEVLRVENSLHYNHLDSLFGKDRKEPLTKQDLQLYSIVNEGRKPLIYDFEF